MWQWQPPVVAGERASFQVVSLGDAQRLWIKQKQGPVDEANADATIPKSSDDVAEN
jgi:hypothetical protein